MAATDTASSGTITEERPSSNGAAPAAPTAPPAQQQPEQDTTPAKKHMKRSTRIALIIIGILALLAAVAFGGTYLMYSSKFVSTDNAQVDGDKILINAPRAGVVSEWRGTQGTLMKTGQYLGRIRLNGTGGAQWPIRAPKSGTIAVDTAVEGQFVQAGTNLATAYDLSRGVYITARVDETSVEGVTSGAPVDIEADAYPGVPISGVVTDIQGSAATQESLFPQSNSTGNFQKVEQVIPVRIALTNSNGTSLVPGMNVTVHIHKPGT